MEFATTDPAIFASATLAYPDNIHQNENPVGSRSQDHARRPEEYFSWSNYAKAQRRSYFGAAGNLNIIRFTIINFVYNAETISRTLVIRVQALEL